MALHTDTHPGQRAVAAAPQALLGPVHLRILEASFPGSVLTACLVGSVQPGAPPHQRHEGAPLTRCSRTPQCAITLIKEKPPPRVFHVLAFSSSSKYETWILVPQLQSCVEQERRHHASNLRKHFKAHVRPDKQRCIFKSRLKRDMRPVII